MIARAKSLASLLIAAAITGPATAQELFQFQQQTTHWTSPETRDAPRGEGGRENQGAKGHPYDTIRAGQSLVLADIQGGERSGESGSRSQNRTPVMLRSLRLDMFWDGATAGGSVPLGDFFGAALGQTVAFENALFSSPEGRSFNTIVPMPFRRRALSCSPTSQRSISPVSSTTSTTRSALRPPTCCISMPTGDARTCRPRSGRTSGSCRHSPGRGR